MANKKKGKQAKKKPAKKQAKKKPAKRKPSEPVIVPERVLAGLTGKEMAVATELLELGEGRRGPFADVRTQKECIARGGIVKRPPPWSRLSFVCAMPPPWAKSRSERAVPGLLRGGDGAAMGVGAFVSQADRCAPGYVKVRTNHPRWGTGEFYMCVLPGTIPRTPAPGRLFGSGLGALRLLPEEISFPMLIVGNLLGVGTGTAASRLLPLFLSDTVANIIKIALGGVGVALYFGTKKSLPLGLALGVLPKAVEGVIDLIAGEVAPATAAGPPTSGITGGRMGQLEPEQIRELERMAEELAGPEAEEYEDYEEPELFGEIPEEIEEEPVIPATPF